MRITPGTVRLLFLEEALQGFLFETGTYLKIAENSLEQGRLVVISVIHTANYIHEAVLDLLGKIFC